MKQKGLIEYLENNNININYKDMDQDTGMTIVKLILLPSNKINEMILDIKDNEDFDIMFMPKIIKKRLGIFNYSDRVTDQALIILTLAGLETPAEAVICTIMIMDLLDKNKDLNITKDNILTDIFPNGVFDKDTSNIIIDILKEDRTKGDKREIKYSMIY